MNRGGEKLVVDHFAQIAKLLKDYTYHVNGNPHKLHSFIVNDLAALWKLILRRKIVEYGSFSFGWLYF